MPRRLKLHLTAALPKLGWIASIPLRETDVTVLHGAAVEYGDDWVVEGVWDTPFEDGAFHESEAFFGSGLRLDGSNVVACTSTALTDRLFYYQTDDRVIVSNSLVVMLAISDCHLDLDHDYTDDYAVLLRGIWKQPHGFRVKPSTIDNFQQLHHGNLIVSGGTVSIGFRSRCHPIDSYEDYLERIRTTITRMRLNYQSAHRHTPMSAFTTLSTGYDSVAVSCLAKEAGVTECFATRPSNAHDEIENGMAIAEVLGFFARSLSKPSVAVTTDEAYFIASSLWGSELIFHDLAHHIETMCSAAVVFTGYHGDKVWDSHTNGHYLADDILRGDASGLNLSEIRLKSGFINLAIPFLFARSIRDIVRIAQSPQMDTWRLGNDDYDRPIPRRIAESAGVPRALFGQRKQMVMSYYNYPYNASLRQAFVTWLDTRFSAGSTKMRLYEIVDAIDWRLERRAATSGMAQWAIRVPRSIKRHLFGNHDLRHLMFKWAANQLADDLQQRLGPTAVDAIRR
jgi:hypothetical protein